jgi:hypothetical protein
MNKTAFKQGFLEKCASLGLSQEQTRLLLEKSGFDLGKTWSDLTGAFKGPEVDWSAIGRNPITHTALGAGLGAVPGGLLGGTAGALGGALAGGGLGAYSSLNGIPKVENAPVPNTSVDTAKALAGIPLGLGDLAFNLNNLRKAPGGILNALMFKAPGASSFAGLSYGPSAANLAGKFFGSLSNIGKSPLKSLLGAGGTGLKFFGTKVAPVLQLTDAARGTYQGLTDPESVVNEVGTKGLDLKNIGNAFWGAIDMEHGGRNIGAAIRLGNPFGAEGIDTWKNVFGAGKTLADVNAKAKDVADFVARNPGVGDLQMIKDYFSRHGHLPGG